MPIDAFEQHWLVGNHRVDVGSGRKATQAPDFLIPPAPQNPAPLGVGLGIFGNLCLRLSQRLGVGQVERQRGNAQPHHMPVRVEQAGQQRAVLSIEPPIGSPVLVGRGLLTLPDQLADPAIGRNGEAGEADDLPLGVERNPVDVIDQPIGERGAAKGEKKGSENDSPKVTKVPRCAREIPLNRGDVATNGGG